MKFVEGVAYEVIFWDHIRDDSAPILCRVYGVIVKDMEQYITVAWWTVTHKDDDVVESNRELVTLLKSTIKKKRKIS